MKTASLHVGGDASGAAPTEGHQGGTQPKRRTKVVKRIIKRVKSPAVVQQPEIPTGPSATVKSPALPESTTTVFMPGERHTTKENVIAFFDPATHRRQLPPDSMEVAPTLPDASQEAPASEVPPGSGGSGEDQKNTPVETGLEEEGKQNNDDENGDEKKNPPVDPVQAGLMKQEDERNKDDENGEDKKNPPVDSVETGLLQEDEQNKTHENSDDQKNTPVDPVEAGLNQNDENKVGETDDGEQENMETPLQDQPAEGPDNSKWTDDEWYWWNHWNNSHYRWWGSWDRDNHEDTNLWSVKRKEPSGTPSTVQSSPSTMELEACLQRASTVDLATAEGTGENGVNNPETNDTKETKTKEQLEAEKEIAKKKAHARYMRYYRSVHESHDLNFVFLTFGVDDVSLFVTKHFTLETR